MSAGPGPRAWPAYVLAALACLAWQAVVVGLGLSPVLEGRLVEGDGYTHLVRAAELAAGEGWYDTVVERTNAPFGTPMHWTRPFDVALLAGAWALSPVLGFDAALFAWGAWLPALLQLACALLLVWAAEPLLDAGRRMFIGPAFALQLGVGAYAMAGRPDHQILVVLGFVATLGLTLRLLAQPFAARRAFVAGAVAGLGLWLSVELLVGLAAACGGLLLAWARGSDDAARTGRWHAAGAIAAVAVALAIERPPSEWLRPDLDRLSIACLAPPALAWSFWSAVRPSAPLWRSARLRWNALLAAAAGVAAAGWLVYRGAFVGSTLVQDQDTRLFFESISENQPLLPRDLGGLGECLLALGSVAVALPCALAQARRARDASRHAWGFVALALVGLAAAALALRRLSPYAECVATLGVAWLTGAALEALGRVAGVASRVGLRTLAAAAILIGPLAVGGAATAAAQADAVDAAPICSMATLIGLLQSPAALGETAHVILTHPTYGPEIIYRTGHAVVGSPDHRNLEGIRDCVGFFRTTDESRALAIVRRRGVDVVIVCRPWLEQAAANMGAGSMAARLQAGELPAWLARAELPGGAEGQFLVLRVPAAP